MSERKWIDNSQPQTLRNAVFLAYLSAAWSVLGLIVGGGILALVFIFLAPAAYGIANDNRPAYYVGIVLAGLSSLVQLLGLLLGGTGFSGIISLLFAVVLFALIIHPESREYQRIWFH